MITVDVAGVRVELPSNQPVLLLRERGGHRHVPVWIGAPEATAIAYAQQGLTPPRPLTHDLLLDVLRAVGRALDHVEVVDLRDEEVFLAELVLDDGTRVSSRTSDAVALALRNRCAIKVAEQVIDATGIEVPDEDGEGERDPEDEVQRFREFLDHVSAEDFEDEG